MSKKFFNLIHHDSVHISPKSKVIPANQFSTLMTAEEVLESVKKDAEKYRIEVAAECEQIKEAAQKEGFEEGFVKWSEKLSELEVEVLKVRGELEKVLIPVALKAAKKIVGREIELNQETIVDIVSNSLKAVAQHKKITIYVSKKDYEVLENNRQRLKQLFESIESLSIRERSDIAPGGCVIETEGGIINAQIDHIWNLLERAFESMMKKGLQETV